MKVHELINHLLSQPAGHEVMLNVAGLDAVPINHFDAAEDGENEIHLLAADAWLVDKKGNRIKPVSDALK